MIISRFHAVVNSTIGLIAFFGTTLTVTPILWIVLCQNADTIFYSSTRETTLKELARIQQMPEDDISRKGRLLAWYVKADEDSYVACTNLAITFVGLTGGVGSGLISLFGTGIIFSILDTKIRINNIKKGHVYHSYDTA